MLTRDQIFTADDIKIEAVKVWGDEVYVRTMDGASRDAFEEACAADRKRIGKKRGIRAWLAVYAVCDANGGRVFDDADVDAVSRKSAAALDAIFAKAAKLNRLFKADIEELEKNSVPGQTDDSGSA